MFKICYKRIFETCNAGWHGHHHILEFSIQDGRCYIVFTFIITFSINGVPACANQELLTNITRNEWGFKGYIVSDAGAVSNIISQHKYLKTAEETVAACIKAGCNLELGSGIFGATLNAMKAGLLNEKQIRDNVRPLMYTRLRLGEFDPETMNPYNAINMSYVQSAAHRELALQAAMKTFVLLKNEKNLLPLKTTYDKVAVSYSILTNAIFIFKIL